MERPLIDIKELSTYFFTYEGVVKALEDVDLTIWPDEIFGLVGETGCGKSVTALSIMKLIHYPPGRIMSGRILFDGDDLVPKNEKEMSRIRGEKIAMIFQEPMSCLNPVMKIGDMMAEVIKLHLKVSKEEASNLAAKALEETEMPDPFHVLTQYPHELSGGMRQRVMIATAMSLRPRLLIADEPTTALDVTIQVQILRLLRRLKDSFKASIMLITHNLGVVAQICGRVAVMYAGGIVEVGSVEDIFEKPSHPYTLGLTLAIPKLDEGKGRLKGIEGSVPDLINPPTGCRFHPRCGYCGEKCRTQKPSSRNVNKGHRVACHLT
jgi:peptide/nickel transport system ATP-binding protein/oligopeptide transport system ATP-binding protein